MGLLSKILRAPRQVGTVGYRTFTENGPAFAPFTGDIYGQELTRSAIDRFAVACSKLKPEVVGEGVDERIKRMVQTQPNSYMTWPRFLYRLATIFEVDTTACVVAAFGPDQRTVVGLWPLKFETAEIVEHAGEPWVRFRFATGESAALEMRYVGFVSKYQYESDFFGSPNCLQDTMALMHDQTQAQRNAMRYGAKIRFIGALTGQVREEDMEDKRKRFTESNLSAQNEGGIMLYDQTFSDVRQVNPSSYVMDSAEMARVRDNVCTYFGISEEILQNRYSEETWGAWYEGKVEPWALQLGEAVTSILFGRTQQMRGKRVMFSSNRLEYASNASKRNMIRDMLDRGVMSLNEGREILQLPPVEGGDVRVIRGEYVNAAAVSSAIGEPPEGGAGTGESGGDNVV